MKNNEFAFMVIGLALILTGHPFIAVFFLVLAFGM